MLRSRFNLVNAAVPFSVFLMAILTSCGGDDSPVGTGGGGGGGLSSTQGLFIDAPVEGLSYASGGKSGLTDATGKFDFEKSADIEFSIGDIVLGTAAPAKRMSPVTLAGAVSVTDPAATNIARLLQTVDDDGNLSNGIQISGAVRAAASGQSLDFVQDPSAFENDTNVQSVVSALTTETQTGQHGLIDAATAQANLTSGIRAGLAGTYSGNACRDGQPTNAGTWTMTVAQDGTATIKFSGSVSFQVAGVMGLDGVLSTSGDPFIYAWFDPDFGGRWYSGQDSGSFSESSNCAQ